MGSGILLLAEYYDQWRIIIDLTACIFILLPIYYTFVLRRLVFLIGCKTEDSRIKSNAVFLPIKQNLDVTISIYSFHHSNFAKALEL